MRLNHGHKTWQCKRMVLTSVKKLLIWLQLPLILIGSDMLTLTAPAVGPFASWSREAWKIQEQQAAFPFYTWDALHPGKNAGILCYLYLSLLIPSEGVFILYHFSKETLSRWKMKGLGVRKKIKTVRLWFSFIWCLQKLMNNSCRIGICLILQSVGSSEWENVP